MQVFERGRQLQLGLDPQARADLRREQRLLAVHFRGRLFLRLLARRNGRMRFPLRERLRDRSRFFSARLRRIDLPTFELASTMLPVAGFRTRRGDGIYHNKKKKIDITSFFSSPCVPNRPARCAATTRA